MSFWKQNKDGAQKSITKTGIQKSKLVFEFVCVGATIVVFGTGLSACQNKDLSTQNKIEPSKNHADFTEYKENVQLYSKMMKKITNEFEYFYYVGLETGSTNGKNKTSKDSIEKKSDNQFENWKKINIDLSKSTFKSSWITYEEKEKNQKNSDDTISNYIDDIRRPDANILMQHVANIDAAKNILIAVGNRSIDNFVPQKTLRTINEFISYTDQASYQIVRGYTPSKIFIDNMNTRRISIQKEIEK